MFENEEIIIKINSAENLEDEIVYFLYQNPEETYSSFVENSSLILEDRSGFYSNGGLWTYLIEALMLKEPRNSKLH